MLSRVGTKGITNFPAFPAIVDNLPNSPVFPALKFAYLAGMQITSFAIIAPAEYQF